MMNSASSQTVDSLKVSNDILKSVELMISMSRAYDKEVIVSGGVFQNRTLLSRFITRSAKKVYFNK